MKQLECFLFGVVIGGLITGGLISLLTREDVLMFEHQCDALELIKVEILEKQNIDSCSCSQEKYTNYEKNI